MHAYVGAHAQRALSSVQEHLAQRQRGQAGVFARANLGHQGAQQTSLLSAIQKARDSALSLAACFLLALFSLAQIYFPAAITPPRFFVSFVCVFASAVFLDSCFVVFGCSTPALSTLSVAEYARQHSALTGTHAHASSAHASSAGAAAGSC
jgi:hypothetical protein